MSNVIYQMITAAIYEKLKAGVIPWRQPWLANGIISWETQKAYRGVNLLLDPGEYATLNQVKKAGGRVKAEEIKNAYRVIFWKMDKKQGEESDEEKLVPILRFYRVYNVGTQCIGIEPKQKNASAKFDNQPIEEAEAIVSGYTTGPRTLHVPGRAFYRPADDFISLPPMEDFFTAEDYYATRFHEMVHSTGHTARLNRPDMQNIAAFGDESYSKEELVAEIGAAMLCGVCGIDNSTLPQSASYIQSWMRRLKEDPRLIIQAAAQAQKAADYIRGISYASE